MLSAHEQESECCEDETHSRLNSRSAETFTNFLQLGERWVPLTLFRAGVFLSSPREGPRCLPRRADVQFVRGAGSTVDGLDLLSPVHATTHNRELARCKQAEDFRDIANAQDIEQRGS
jgi:hypothetical protein